MPVFYKERGQNLPTVVYNGDTFYDFVWNGSVFVCDIDDQKAVKLLTGMGYSVVGMDDPQPDPTPETPVEDTTPSSPPRAKVPKKL